MWTIYRCVIYLQLPIQLLKFNTTVSSLKECQWIKEGHPEPPDLSRLEV